tara:strand:- start:38351 stop:40051 length:1701 start_codon:yes stop_codon:yes gene_type:complete
MFEKIKVPSLGEPDSSLIQEILVSINDDVNVGDILFILETSKAAIEVPSTAAGKVIEINASIGDEVKSDQPIILLEVLESEANSKSASAQSHDSEFENNLDTQVVVIGSGPGGYAAAFRAADLGKDVILVDDRGTLGGVCLNVGCIPSKALLHVAKVISESTEMEKYGVKYSSLNINLDKLRSWKETVLNQLTNGLADLASKRNVRTINGKAEFVSNNKIIVRSENNSVEIDFQNAVIATGSRPIQIANVPNDDTRILSSTGALEIESVPNRMLVIGGGIIGLEMATVYNELGANVTVVEFADTLMPGTDADLVNPLLSRIKDKYENIYLSSKVTDVETTKNGLFVKIDTPNGVMKDVFDKVLVCVGRIPNSNNIGVENLGIEVDEKGFITTDKYMRTNVENIYAVGDVVGQPMLAHKASMEGKIAAEDIAGLDIKIDDSKLIPSVAYTDPEVAWVGITEEKAKELKINYSVSKFPWVANGRSLSINRKEGCTKLIYELETSKIIGAGIIGTNAGDLISEITLAIKKECTANEISQIIHPHPTFSETIGQSAEVFENTIVDLYIKG